MYLHIHCIYIGYILALFPPSPARTEHYIKVSIYIVNWCGKSFYIWVAFIG